MWRASPVNLVREVFSIRTRNTAPTVNARPNARKGISARATRGVSADAVKCARVGDFAAGSTAATRDLGHSSWAERCAYNMGRNAMSHEIPGKITQREQVSNK